MKTIYLVIITLILIQLTSCNQKVSPPMNTRTVADLAGNYVSDEYSKRNEGYDWVAVSVKQLSDSMAHISFRSRADKKKPTCTFDANAVLIRTDTLQAVVEGSTILFAFSDSSVTVATEREEDESILYYYCSGGGSLAGIYTKIAEPLDETQIDKTIFLKNLNYNEFFFSVNHTGNELTIQPVGLEIDNTIVKHEIIGGVITNAEIGDLNIDGFPEVLVYITSVGSGSYGSVIGYSVNNGKSMSQINLPNVADNPEANKGYMGHDEFAIVESTFNQRFPIYKPGDPNTKPTGGMRQVQYKLKDGENSCRLVVDKIVEY